MSEKLNPEQRSRNMAAVKNKNTAPEIIVRKTLHRLGYRFRLHRRDLPGNPDIVLPKYRAVIFVHGCFWHGHPGCSRASRPQTTAEFWNTKLDKNLRRDQEVQARLHALGWRVLVIWQCRTKDREQLEQQINHFLQSTPRINYGTQGGRKR